MLHPEVSVDDAHAMHRVDGRVVIVTGSGQGVGRGMANHLAKNGATVVVADYQPDKARRTRDELAELGASALDVEVDIRDRASLHAMVERVVTELGRVDALINNAQTFRANAPMAEVAADDLAEEELQAFAQQRRSAMLLQASATVVGAFLPLLAVVFYLVLAIFYVIDPIRLIRTRSRRQTRAEGNTAEN